MSDTRFTKEEVSAMRETALAVISGRSRAISKSQAAQPQETRRAPRSRVQLFPSPEMPHKEGHRHPIKEVRWSDPKGGFLRKQIFVHTRTVLKKRDPLLVRMSKILCVVSMVIGGTVVILAFYLFLYASRVGWSR